MDNGGIVSQIEELEKKVTAAVMPTDLKENLMQMVHRLRAIEHEMGFLPEYEMVEKYSDWVCALPWERRSVDILDLAHARAVLDKNHFGLEEVKSKILEFLSVLILRNSRGATEDFVGRAPILSLVGLVGTGKTTIAYSIAEALGRKIERIPFGGLGGPAMIRGQSRAYPGAEPGFIIKALKRAGTNNPVILLDEIDRVSDQTRSDIMGALVELLDPEQNKAFLDHYIDYPFNLSNVLFIATSNNTKDISIAVLDRLEVMQMPSYSDREKMVIGKSYMLPKVLAEASLTEHDIMIDESVWEYIIRPLGYDPGIRSLQRTIQGLVRKVARNIIEGKAPAGQPVRIDQTNVKEYLPQW